MGGLVKVMMTTCVTAAVADNAVTDVCLDGYPCLAAAAPSSNSSERTHTESIGRWEGGQQKAIYTMWSHSRSAWRN